MLIKDFKDLPAYMQNDEVRKYYDYLQSRRIQLILKRLFDITAAIILCILLSPVFLFLSIWIKLDSKGPIFYRQERITQYGKSFRIFKFRTMVVDADKKGTLVTVENDSRITKVGNKIRKCRLDEIPQLFNVLKGEMSFVGTRPEVKKYVESYSDEMNATLLLPAGITSLASIKYREEDLLIKKYAKEDKDIDNIYISKILPQKMKWNLLYLEKFSIWSDLWLCVKTIF